MQFLVTAYDYKDGLERRLAVRDQHLKLIDQLIEEGKCLYAAQLVDDNEKMIGSVMIFDYPTRGDLDDMLKSEPYTLNKVWETVDIVRCNVAPKFLK